MNGKRKKNITEVKNLLVWYIEEGNCKVWFIPPPFPSLSLFPYRLGQGDCSSEDHPADEDPAPWHGANRGESCRCRACTCMCNVHQLGVTG